MDPIKENFRIAKEIIRVLKENNCTIEQSDEVIEFVKQTIKKTSIVQFEGFPY